MKNTDAYEARIYNKQTYKVVALTIAFWLVVFAALIWLTGCQQFVNRNRPKECQPLAQVCEGNNVKTCNPHGHWVTTMECEDYNNSKCIQKGDRAACQ
jgi:hypothetical protein